MKKLIPTYVAKNIFEISIDFYHKNKIKYIFSDLDNTLDSFKLKVPSQRTIDFISNLKKEGINLIILSNNNANRVSKYAKILEVDYIYKSGKPFSKRLKKYLEKNNIPKDSIVVIGDQLLTDIKCANNLGVRSIYTDDIVEENAFVTKINKFFESFPKKKLIKNKTFKNRED